jgi:hypothetical protein
MSTPKAHSSLADFANAKRWVAWRMETRKDEPTKMPKNPATGGNARVPTAPSTYGTRVAAEKRWQKLERKGVVGGIGIVLGKLNNDRYLAGIDLDSCRERKTGKIADWAKEVDQRFATYAEVSPSGSGIKLFFLMSAADMGKLHARLGFNGEGKQITRKTFAAGEHREVAIDIARFYAVTNQQFGKVKNFRLVPFSDVAWFIDEVGPHYLAQQREGNGHADPFAAYGNELHADLDKSGSGYGYRFMMDRRGEGMDYEEAREAILADDYEAGEWANRSDERQLKRAWENSAPPPPISEPERECPTLAPEALYGLVGKVVRLFDPHTEAHPAAILVQFLVSYGNMLDRTAYYQIEGDKHFSNLFALMVGPTGEGRKGVSAGRVRQLMKLVDEEWTNKCVQSGLSSGEGIIHTIRDEVTKETEKEGTVVVDEGVADKRLMLDEREFAQALTVMKREGNTVSRIIRDSWDGREQLTNLVKHSKEVVTNAMISIVGHITPEELTRMMDETSMFNGYANRFLLTYVCRSKLLPFGGNLLDDDPALIALAQEVSVARDFVRRNEKWEHVEPYGLKMDAETREMWASLYPKIVTKPPGLLGAICGRAEAQVSRLALCYAATDCSEVIKRVHLQAALALWKYSADSARFIWGESFGDPLADHLLNALRSSGGMSRTRIRDLCGRNQRSDKIDAALAMLKKHGKAHCEMRSGTRGGPKVEFWQLAE